MKTKDKGRGGPDIRSGFGFSRSRRPFLAFHFVSSSKEKPNWLCSILKKQSQFGEISKHVQAGA
jgi:hypothetical protein